MTAVIPTAQRRKQLTAQAAEYARDLHKAGSYLIARGISLEAAEMFGLGYVTEGNNRGRLSIPYQTPAGVVQIKYRCIEHDNCKDYHADKYRFEAGLGVHLFNAQVLIRSSDLVVLTEGELDAICVQAYCGIPAVAYPGVDTWSKQSHWRLCFEGVDEVVVIADGDDQGKDAARRIAHDIGTSARVVDMPEKYDSNLYIATNGVAAFQERIFQ